MYSFARFVYYKLARELTTLSYQAIGDSVNRDHSTVLYGVREIENVFTFDDKILKDYNYLKQRLDPKRIRTEDEKKKDYINLALYYRNKYLQVSN